MAYLKTSAAAHERKPNIGFYKHVIDNSGIDPSRTIFVDDKIENVLTARSFGMHGIVFDNQEKVIQQLKNLCGDPIARGQNFLASHKQRLTSVTSSNVELAEVSESARCLPISNDCPILLCFIQNFAQLLILEATHDR